MFPILIPMFGMGAGSAGPPDKPRPALAAILTVVLVVALGASVSGLAAWFSLPLGLWAGPALLALIAWVSLWGFAFNFFAGQSLSNSWFMVPGTICMAIGIVSLIFGLAEYTIATGL